MKLKGAQVSPEVPALAVLQICQGCAREPTASTLREHTQRAHSEEYTQRAHSASTLSKHTQKSPQRLTRSHTHILGTRWSQLNPKGDLISLDLLVLHSIPGNTLFGIDADCIPNHGRSSPGPGGRREGQARTLLQHSQAHLSGGAL